MIFIDTIYYGGCMSKSSINNLLRHYQSKGAKIVSVTPILYNVRGEGYHSSCDILIVYEAEQEIPRD